METYIFFDTNILEIPERKDFSQFRFSSNYTKTKEIIDKYDLGDSVIPIVPCIVVNELLEHYKVDYKSKIQSYRNKIDEINDSFSEMLVAELAFKPQYKIHEYMDFIKESKEKYLRENLISTIDCPDVLKPILSRAVKKNKPFELIEKGKSNGRKTYIVAGFKDVVIWESILNHNFEHDDIIILFSNDNVFHDQCFHHEIDNQVIPVRTINMLLETLLQIFNIDKELFEYREYISGDYFIDAMLDYLELLFFDEVEYKVKDIDLCLDGATINRVSDYEVPGTGEVIEGISVNFAPMINYSEIKTNTDRAISIVIVCVMREREIEFVGYLDEFDLEQGTLIEEESEGVK